MRRRARVARVVAAIAIGIASARRRRNFFGPASDLLFSWVLLILCDALRRALSRAARCALEAYRRPLIGSVVIVVAGNQKSKWPIDLRLCGYLSAVWAFYLALKIFDADPMIEASEPIHALVGGILFYGQQARVLMLVEAGIFWAIAMGLIRSRNWGLMLALIYGVEVVISHLVFVIAYRDVRPEWYHVHLAANEGPFVVLLTLYLWIRACDLIFVEPRPGAPHR